MLFNSLTFLVFLAIFFSLWPLFRDLRRRNLYITLSSYVFYGFWNSPFLLLLILSTVVDYWAGRLIDRSESPRTRKAMLVASLAYNLGVLFAFKYFSFFMDTCFGLFSVLGIHWQPPAISIVLPVGISFYTFVTLSYTIDVWRREIKAEKDFIKYAAFVSYWPHLVAGPILRAKQLLPQLSKRRAFRWQLFYQGFFLVTFGFFMKMVVADNMAGFVERVYNRRLPLTMFDAWLATYAYALQIYGDFSGYSNIAIGLALIMGFQIPQNFNAPYAATSFSDFWKRWHISLSTWFRDYLFLMLAYPAHRRLEKVSLCARTRNQAAYAIAITLTMLVCGLWHGAAWNFVAWGFIHGLCLAAERRYGAGPGPNREAPSPWRLFLKRLVIFHLICLTWVLFRADFGRASKILKAMVGLGKSGAEHIFGPSVAIPVLALLAATLLIQHWFADKDFIRAARAVRLTPWGFIALEVLLILCALMAMGGQNAFIYFKF
jgi:D-alanyl-lipoteichoic acid acyltransferase DltB (MBOAT superfamily)